MPQPQAGGPSESLQQRDSEHVRISISPLLDVDISPQAAVSMSARGPEHAQAISVGLSVEQVGCLLTYWDTLI